MEAHDIFNSNVLNSFRDFIRSEVDKGIREYIQATQTMQKEPDEYLTIGQVSKYTKISKPTLWAWHKNGYLQKHFIGGIPRYRKSDVDAAMLKREASKRKNN